MGALFSRITTWGSAATLTSAALNAEFNNILNNFIPTMMQGYSVNAAQMQIQTSPGNVGSESLATALSGELERLRFMIAEIMGNTYWYQTPVSSIAALNNALGASAQANKVSSGLTAATTGISTYLIPSGSTNSVSVAGATTALSYTITSGSYNINSNLTLAGLPTTGAVGAAIEATVSDTSIISGQTWTQLLGENGSTINIATVGSSITPLVGKLIALKNQTSSELFIGRLNAGGTALYDCNRAYFMTSGSTWAARSNITNGDLLQLLTLNWIYATTAGGLTTSQTNPTYSATAPAAPSNGDYWFNMTLNYWETYNGSSWVAANATLIGMCCCDNTKCIGARSIDPFGNYQSTNTVELFVDGVSLIRNRFEGSTVNVFGNVLSIPKSYATWGNTTYEGSSGTAASTPYYLYISPVGQTYTSVNPPYNRPDLGGYYHPSAQFRCLGYVTTDSAGNFSMIESFYKTNPDFSAATGITAAISNLPYPYIIPPRQQSFSFSCVSGAVTQGIPHPSQWKSQRLIYTKTDNSSNPLVLQAFGNSILTTTTTTTIGQTILGSLGSTSGLLSGITYLVSGPGIPMGSTATYPAAGTNATLGQNALVTVSTAITFATTPVGGGFQIGNQTSIPSAPAGAFTLGLYSPMESVELYSDGASIIPLSHRIPAMNIIIGNGLTIGGTTTAPTIGSNFSSNVVSMRREGNIASINYILIMTGAGTAGSGDYLVQLPSIVVPDIQFTSTYALSAGTDLAGLLPSQAALLPSSGQMALSTSVVAINNVLAYLYSSTQFRVSFLNDNSGSINGSNWGSGFFPISSAGGLGFNLTIKVPVLNWW